MRVLVLLLFCACFMPAAEADGNAAGTVRYAWKDASALRVVEAVAMQLQAQPYVDTQLCEILVGTRITMEGTATDWMAVTKLVCAELRKRAKQDLPENEEAVIRSELLQRNGVQELVIRLERWKGK